MVTSQRNCSVVIMSDPHLIADKLHDSGPAFQRMRDTSAGKDLDHQETALKAFVQMMLEEKPQAVIITGDITFNGAKVSAATFSAIFKPLTEEGVAVLIIPGNHDIFDGWARKFSGKDEYRIDQVSPKSWRQIFSYSYRRAVKTDPSSLAYSVAFNPDYRFIMADSNIYGDKPSLTHPVTHGFIGKRQMQFIEGELQEAQRRKQHVLFFMHHNLFVHNVVVNEGFVLDNAADLRRLLIKYRVRLVFSGHIHAQSIRRADKKAPINEIVSSCFSATDQGFGRVQLTSRQISYQRYSFDPGPYLDAAERSNSDLKHFHVYLYDIFKKTSTRQIADNFGNIIKDPAQMKQISALLTRMQWLYFIGASYKKRDELRQMRSSHLFQVLIKRVPLLRGYLDSLSDVTHDDQKLIVKF